MDDEESLTQLAEGMLSRLGYTVITRMNASAALELFCAQPDTFDIVITDQTMPGMTGITLAKSLLKVRPDLPIVLCTGYSDAVSQASAKTAGVREFLMNPSGDRILPRLSGGRCGKSDACYYWGSAPPPAA